MARRVGSSVCVHGHYLYRWRGDTAIRRNIPMNEIEIFDFTTGSWTSQLTTPNESSSTDLPLAITGASIVGIRNKLYLFGGFGALDSESYYRDLFELDLKTFIWRKLIASNDREGPMEKYLCGMIELNEGKGSLLIFGGFGQQANGIPLQKTANYHLSKEFSAMWTNEMHLFDIGESKWITPHISGTQPPPCAAASFTRIDQSRVILFAGRQHASRVNELYILNLDQWRWSGAIVQSSPEEPWPQKRSLQTAVCLVDPQYVKPLSHLQDKENKENLYEIHPALSRQQVLIIWGQDVESDQITDTWILYTDTMKWKEVHLLNGIEGRKWHSSCVYHSSPYEAAIIVSGGFKKNERDWRCPNHDDIVILKLGIPSLYELCIKYMCTIDDVASLLNYLPKHIQHHIDERMMYLESYEFFNLFDYTPGY